MSRVERQGWRDVNRLLFVSLATAAIASLHGQPSRFLTAAGIACAVVGSLPVFHGAYHSIVQRRATIELPIAAATIAALALREVFAALVITLSSLLWKFLWG